MNTPTRQHIYIYDHPESKIRFLEMSLDGQDWRATVVFPQNDPNIDLVRKTLEKRGYTARLGQDGKGHALLEIHHLGKGGHVSAVFHEAGLTRGVAHAISHPGDTFGKLITAAKASGAWLEGSLHDPARANGIVNTVAEGFLASAGHGAQYGKFTDPKNALQSMAGISWLAQSLTYLFFAKNNENRAAGVIETKIEQIQRAGGDIVQMKFDPAKDAQKDTLGDKAMRFMRRYTVTIGAMMNNLGMAFYIGHAFLERKFRLGHRALNPHDVDATKYVGRIGDTGIKNWIKTGFGKDIVGASLSLVGWTVLMIPPTKHVLDEEQLDNRGPLKKAWDTFREHTPFVAGLTTLGASSFRLMGATSKGNVTQQIGEKIYIGGDFALMFTNSHEYGGDAKLNQEKLSAMVVSHIGKQPILLGEKSQKEFVENAVQYWLAKFTSDAAKEHKTPESYRAWVEASAKDVHQEVMRKVCHQQTERMEHLAECVAETVLRFPETQRAELTKAMAASLSSMSWMRAGEQEIEQHITAALKKLPTPTGKAALLNEEMLAADMNIIVGVVPGIDKALASAQLYDAMAPFMAASRPQSKVTDILNSPITKKQSATHVARLETAGVNVATRG